jgi:large conductance mechanosensitive channel
LIRDRFGQTGKFILYAASWATCAAVICRYSGFMGALMLEEFKKFISRGNVIDLAVGIIVGSAFTAIVTSLVNDVLMPPLGYVMGGIDFSDYFISLSGGDYATLGAAKDAGAATINYGLFINAVIKFFIVAWAVFILVKQVNRLHRKEDAIPAAPTKDQLLLTEIRDLLKERQQS